VLRLFLSMSNHFAPHGATIDSREIFFYCSGEQCLPCTGVLLASSIGLDEAGRTTGEVVGLDAAVA
jgi:hypothetical protein